MAKGTVKWFDTKKGYGFAVNEKGEDVFIHYTSITGEGFRCLKEDQIIEYDVTKQKIYSYPADEYVRTLSERTRDQAASQFAEATRGNQFLLFVKDTKNQRLRSYVFDLPE